MEFIMLMKHQILYVIFRIFASLQLDGCQRIIHLLTTSCLAFSTISPFFVDLVCGRATNGTIPFKSSFWPKTSPEIVTSTLNLGAGILRILTVAFDRLC